MKIISEYTLTKDEIKKYRSKGYEIYYGNETFKINQGESVGFLLDTLYKSTIDLITSLLYRRYKKSKITIKYKDKIYKLRTITDWSYSYKDPKLGKTITEEHIILKDYKLKRAEYFVNLKQKKDATRINNLLVNLDNKIPEDLDKLLEAFTGLYDIEIGYGTEFELEDKLRAYISIKWYLDNDIEYIRDILGYLPTEEKMFETTSFGNETYLEDFIYKNT